MSDQDPGPTPTPYGQSPGQPDPYGQSNPYGQPPYGQSYGQFHGAGHDRRPGTVTAAAWITIVFSSIVAVIFGFTTLALIVARDQVITEMEKVPEFRDANIDPDAAVGVLVAVMVGILVWSIIAVVLAVMVLRRSNVARILLVISASVTALFSLLGITSGISAVLLIAAVAAIVLLFTGGAGDWFKRLPTTTGGGGYGGYDGGGQYGGGQPGQESGSSYPPPSQNPYGQPPSEGGDQPPQNYPRR